MRDVTIPNRFESIVNALGALRSLMSIYSVISRVMMEPYKPGHSTSLALGV